MAEKSRDAFRTISEVADWLDVPTHVLRLWESRFSQIKPVKRAGGRRYYRPSDMRVIGGVKVLLHDQGMTIRGVQKLFREEGIKHVSGFSPDLFDGDDSERTPLNEEALEIAARPAPAARTTRDAEPDPIKDQTPLPSSAEAETEDAEAAPLFRRSQTRSVDSEPEATEAQPTPAEQPAASIPDTPDVPATDAADDDKDHARSAGASARLKLVAPNSLDAHRETLAEAATRLRALLDKAS